jgi:hypothetical protein
MVTQERGTTQNTAEFYQGSSGIDANPRFLYGPAALSAACVRLCFSVAAFCVLCGLEQPHFNLLPSFFLRRTTGQIVGEIAPLDAQDHGGQLQHLTRGQGPFIAARGN